MRNTTEYSLSSRLETRSFVIPHWLILACYLPFWIGLSLWDVRRIKRRIAAANPPIPE